MEIKARANIFKETLESLMPIILSSGIIQRNKSVSISVDKSSVNFKVVNNYGVFNNEISIFSPHEIIGEGEICVDGKSLFDLLSSFGEEEVSCRF